MGVPIGFVSGIAPGIAGGVVGIELGIAPGPPRLGEAGIAGSVGMGVVGAGFISGMVGSVVGITGSVAGIAAGIGDEGAIGLAISIRLASIIEAHSAGVGIGPASPWWNSAQWAAIPVSFI